MSAARNAILALVSLFASSNASAHLVDDPRRPDNVEIVVLGDPAPSAAEEDMITISGLTGPRDSSGISSIDPLGTIDLGEEYRSMQCREMRARVFTIEPGGVIGIHAHEQRPGYAFIISGSIVEHRNDESGPLVRNPGDIAIEKGGVAHWWENPFAEPVRALVVDIFTPE